MKKFSFSVLMVLVMIQSASASVFSVEKTETINKRAEEILEILMDYENTCDSGCRYKVSNVTEMKILEKPAENQIYTWYKVDNVKDITTYNFVEKKKISENEFQLVTVIPPYEKIKELKEKYGHSQNNLFDSVENVWTIKENLDETGKFLNSTVTYTSKAISDNIALRMFSGVVRKEMKVTADEQFDNLK